MSTPAAIDLRVLIGEVIEPCRVKGVPDGAQRADRHNQASTSSRENRVTLMDTMCVDASTTRSATTVADTRDTTRAFLGDLGQPAVDPEVVDTVLLVVSELVTNAVRHGGGAYRVSLTAHPGLIEVAVDDSSPRAPRMRTPDLHGGTGGFGWSMVNRLAHATAVTRHPSGGKTVTALIAR
jgi:anti-sigma regulatory factor (Ser/Thr protein kinase)